MILIDLKNKNIIHPPSWLPLNTQYLTYNGSVAYGVSSDTSDCDIYGFTIPEKHLIFPHLAGEIPGFGRQRELPPPKGGGFLNQEEFSVSS